MNLVLPEGFLNGEVRDGFYVERMMKRNWACMIKMLAEIDRICRKYDIRYYADWGTMLGAVRHKGFIPWDDDIDISMFRQDYVKFCQIAPKELPPNWEINNVYTSCEWNDILAHVVNGRTVNYDPDHLDEFYGFPYIPGIDIFPLDYVAPTKEEHETICNILNIISYTVNHYNDLEENEDEKLAAVESIANMCGVNIDVDGNIVNQLLRLQEKLSMMYTADESDKVSFLVDCANNHPQRVYDKEWFADTIMMPFEYIEVPVPIGYEEILNREIGDDWRVPMIIPDHEYPYYKKQQKEAWTALGVL